MKAASLCAGIGGADLALEALGFDIAWHAEIDPDASTVLAHRWPGVPNLGNVRQLDLDALAGAEAIAAGYPCQPFSLAGQRKGADDPRHLWPAIRDAVAAVRPRLVFLENVRGHLTLGWPEVRADLDALGYVGAWGVLGSAAVGGCHRRERLWIVATPDPGGRSSRPQPDAEPGRSDPMDPRQHRPPAAQVGDLLPTPAAADGARGPDLARAARPESGGMDLVTVTTRLLPTPRAERGGWNHNHPDGSPRRSLRDPTLDFGRYQAAVDRWSSIFGPPPPPTIDTYKGARKHYDEALPLGVDETAPGRRLNPAFPEWMMGFPAGWATDLVPGDDALRCIGNAQQPQTAVAAWGELLARLERQAVAA